MDDIDSFTPSPNPKKRPLPDALPNEKLLNLKGAQFMLPTPPDNSSSASEAVGTNDNDAKRTGSPAPSSSALSSIEMSSNELLDGAGMPPATSTQTGFNTTGPQVKKRKLNPAEKEAKEREKAQQKAEKEVEKAKRDEEKRLKDEEKQRKAEEKEAKKREKALEEERKEQEKTKKERQQMRLGAFFQKPATPAKSGNIGTSSPSRFHGQTASSSTTSHASPFKSIGSSSTEAPTSDDMYVSDYHKVFLPFQLASHTSMNFPITLDPSEMASSLTGFDMILDSNYRSDPTESRSWCEGYFPGQHITKRGVEVESVGKLSELIDGTSQCPVDLTDSEDGNIPLQRMRKATVRHLHFGEDVRPAYFGTYTKVRSSEVMRHAARSPFARVRPDTDYDIDSEAEWEEPDEGDEDCLSDEEEDADSQGDAEEIEAFLDDEDDTMKNKRKANVTDLTPASTGLCWQGSDGLGCPEEMHDMAIEFIIPGFSGQSIDPFSTAYWTNEPASVSSSSLDPGCMAPPRLPLQPRVNSNGALQHDLVGAAAGQKGPITSAAAIQRAKRASKPASKQLSKEDLEEFKEAVVGSPLGKLDLLKGLKARFPKITQETIKETLGSHFAQIGNNRVEKKWVFISAT